MLVRIFNLCRLQSLLMVLFELVGGATSLISAKLPSLSLEASLIDDTTAPASIISAKFIACIGVPSKLINGPVVSPPVKPWYEVVEDMVAVLVAVVVSGMFIVGILSLSSNDDGKH